MLFALLNHFWVLLCTDSLFGISLSVYTPCGYLAAPALLNIQQLPVLPGALQLFSIRFFIARFSKLISANIFSAPHSPFPTPAILIHHRLPYRILCFPIIKSGFADTYLPTDIFNCYASLLLLDRCNYLAFCKSLFHCI